MVRIMTVLKNSCMILKRHSYQILLAALFFLSCCNLKQQTGEKASVAKADSTTIAVMPGKPVYRNYDDEISIGIFKNEAPVKGYGYDINLKGSPYIHQPNIPGLPGNDGFETEIAARKTAELVAFKIKKKIMPPGVNSHELDSIGVFK